jgi:erythromycin esterase-like protein
VSREALDAIRRSCLPFDCRVLPIEAVLGEVGGAPIVLIGEASHGTQEFYRLRAEITKALILRRGFNIVAVEADWPDAYRANRWVLGQSADARAEDALGDFHRFPRWMWRNREVAAFLAWLRAHNSMRAEPKQTGFYGLDLYSLHRSMAAVLDYLAKVDPGAAGRARERYACFDHFGEDTASYGYAASLGVSPSCEREVVATLVDLRRQAAEYATRDGRIAADDYFFAEQNARLVRNAEGYYRSMFAGRVESWNLRDTHMMETLEALLRHVGRTAGQAKAVIWAHNSHLGDARATDMGDVGELNLGQLVRESHGVAACTIGFTTHSGSVTAASNWDEPAAHRLVRPSLPGSYERLFHDTGVACFVLRLHDDAVHDALSSRRLERAIGVIYRPETERRSHYFHASLPEQFDLVIHVDETRALEPLEPWSLQEADLPETYPTGV